MRTAGVLESFLQDARHGLRTMLKKPGFTATAILTLALAIGGNTAMFTVIRAVLLKPLEYRDPDQLVAITGGATPTRFQEMRAAAKSYTELGAYVGPENITLSGGAEPEVLLGLRVSAGFLQVAGVEPMIGRSFRPEEDAPGGTPVALISYELWQRRFGGDRQIAGKTATLSGTEYTIIGVTPQNYHFPVRNMDLLLTGPADDPLVPVKSRELSPFLTVLGRLKPGVSIEQANAEMKVLRQQYARAHPAMLDAKLQPVEVAPMKESVVSGVRLMLLMLFGAVGLVLMIACANVASLLLARASARSREFAVRSALGAGRGRLVRQLLAESALLSFAGGAVGMLLAAWSLRAIPGISALKLPRVSEIHLDGMVLAFTAALSIATGVLFGLAPSLGASRPDLMSTLRISGDSAGKAAPNRILAMFNARGLLVVGQIALSVVLLIGAALLVESIAHLRSVDVGFNPSNLLTVRVSLPPLRYDTVPKRIAFYRDLVRGTETLPGVESGVAAIYAPMMGFAGTPVQDAAQAPRRLNERPIEAIVTTLPGYFRTLKIPLRRGRDFTEADSESEERVTIIDEGLARQFWPTYPQGEDPVGKRLLIGSATKAAQIVGIAANVRQSVDGSRWPGTVYLPFTAGVPLAAPQSAILILRTQGDPLRYTSAIREQVRQLDRDQPISNVETMDALVEAQVGQRRLLMILLESFAGVALALSLIGIYGVIAYSVSQRTREVGIRRALGAAHGDILWLIIGQSLALVVAGIVLGVGGAFAATRVATTVLFQVSATDPATFVGVAVIFLVVAVAASYVPARRAVKIDPMAALRT